MLPDDEEEEEDVICEQNDPREEAEGSEGLNFLTYSLGFGVKVVVAVGDPENASGGTTHGKPQDPEEPSPTNFESNHGSDSVLAFEREEEHYWEGEEGEDASCDT